MALHGDPDHFLPGLGALLAALPSAMLVCAGRGQIAAAEAFAARHSSGDALVVLTLPAAGSDWASAREAAELWAFTRWAALACASRGLRINAIAIGRAALLPDQPAPQAARPGVHAPATPATADDVAAAIRLFWSAKSLTGQLVRLGA